MTGPLVSRTVGSNFVGIGNSQYIEITYEFPKTSASVTLVFAHLGGWPANQYTIKFISSGLISQNIT